MTGNDFKELMQIALEVADEAAALAWSGHRTKVAATEKGRADLVTQYDVGCERLIRQRLRERTPELAIVGEEQGGAPSGLTWYCDPIDGTTNFVHGHPFFCVSLGLMQGGEPVLGAVVAPALQLRFSGYQGGGAFRNGEPCRVSGAATLKDSLIATGFHPQVLARGELDHPRNFRSVLGAGVHGIRICGSAALDLCLVADGTYDAYWEGKLHAWDTAGGAAIALAAGARITDLKGGAPDLSVGHILVSNGLIHDQLLALL